MKPNLIDQLREDHGLTSADAKRAVDQVFASLRAALERSTDDTPSIQIRGFGTFRRKLRDTREVRNPRTGEKSVKQAHHVLTFRESKTTR